MNKVRGKWPVWIDIRRYWKTIYKPCKFFSFHRDFALYHHNFNFYGACDCGCHRSRSMYFGHGQRETTYVNSQSSCSINIVSQRRYRILWCTHVLCICQKTCLNDNEGHRQIRLSKSEDAVAQKGSPPLMRKIKRRSSTHHFYRVKDIFIDVHDRIVGPERERTVHWYHHWPTTQSYIFQLQRRPTGPEETGERAEKRVVRSLTKDRIYDSLVSDWELHHCKKKSRKSGEKGHEKLDKKIQI